MFSSSMHEAATTSTSSSNGTNNGTSSSSDQSEQPSTSGRFNPQVTTFDDDLPHECSYYEWKWGSKINYVRAGRSGPPLLLCHGFGVGSYHFDRNIPVLAQDHRVRGLPQPCMPQQLASCCGRVRRTPGYIRQRPDSTLQHVAAATAGPCTMNSGKQQLLVVA
jgi:hypothetical protein